MQSGYTFNNLPQKYSLYNAYEVALLPTVFCSSRIFHFSNIGKGLQIKTYARQSSFAKHIGHHKKREGIGLNFSKLLDTEINSCYSFSTKKPIFRTLSCDCFVFHTVSAVFQPYRGGSSEVIVNPNARVLFQFWFSPHSTIFSLPLPVKSCKFLPMLGTHGH